MRDPGNEVAFSQGSFLLRNVCLLLQEVFESVAQLDGENYFICDLDVKKVCLCVCVLCRTVFTTN